MSAAESECRESDLRVYADPGDFASFQALFPDSMRRLRGYIDRTDCRARAVIVLPDLAPDDGLPVGVTMVTNRLVYPYAVGLDPGCGYGCWLIKDAREHFNVARLKDWVNNAPWQPYPAEVDLTNAVAIDGKSFADDCLAALSLVPESPPVHIPPNMNRLSARLREGLLRLSSDLVGGLPTGNHFVELHEFTDTCASSAAIGSTDLLLVVHSGSSDFGRRVQMYGLRLAAGDREITPDDLPFLSLDAQSDAGTAYLIWHQWSVRFAAANRVIIAARALRASFGSSAHAVLPLSDLVHSGIIQRPGSDGWWHLSGTQLMESQTIAYVGGTVGGPSLLVRAGKRIAESLYTISHGSGQAFRELPDVSLRPVITNLCRERLERLGRGFRNIDSTMKCLSEAGLVEPLARTQPLAIVKF